MKDTKKGRERERHIKGETGEKGRKRGIDRQTDR